MATKGRSGGLKLPMLHFDFPTGCCLCQTPWLLHFGSSRQVRTYKDEAQDSPQFSPTGMQCFLCLIVLLFDASNWLCESSGVALILHVCVLSQPEALARDWLLRGFGPNPRHPSLAPAVQYSPLLKGKDSGVSRNALAEFFLQISRAASNNTKHRCGPGNANATSVA